MFQLTKFLKKLTFSKRTRVYFLKNIAEMHNTINLAFLQLLTNKLKLRGIYITLNKPQPALLVDLKRRNIDLKKIYVIDCISGKQKKNTENCVFVKNPASLFELSHQLSEIKKTGKYQFVFIDSITTLLMHYPEQEVINFLRFHINKTTRHLNDYLIFSTRYHPKTNKLFNTLKKEFKEAKIIESQPLREREREQHA